MKKRIFLSIITLLHFFISNAQEIWSKSPESPNGISLSFATNDGNGGFWLNGTYNKPPQQGENDTLIIFNDTIFLSNDQSFLAYFDPNGKLQEKIIFTTPSATTLLNEGQSFQSKENEGNLTVDGDSKIISTNNFYQKIKTTKDSISVSGDFSIFKLNKNSIFDWFMEGSAPGKNLLHKNQSSRNIILVADFNLHIFKGTKISFENYTFNEITGFFLARIAKNGSIKWVKVVDAGKIGDYNSELDISDIAFDENDNIYVTGDLKDSISFDNQTFIRDQNGPDPFIAKFDSLGKFQWFKAISVSSSAEVFNIKIYNGKGYIGGFMGPGVIGNDTLSGYGSFLAQFDLNGNFTWARRFTPGSTVTNLQFNKDGIYVGLNNPGFSIHHIDFMGDEKWNYINRNNNYARIFSLGLDSLDNPSVIGKYSGPLQIGDSFYYATPTDIFLANIVNCNDFVAETDPSTNFSIWDTQSVSIKGKIPLKYQIINYAWLQDNTLSSEDSFIFTLSPPYNSLKPKTALRFIAEGKFGCIDTSETLTIMIKDTGTSIEPLTIDNILKLYPNPSRDKVIVEFPSTINNLNLKIINIRGEIIHYEKIPAGTKLKTFSIRKFSRGLYFLQITDNNKVLTNKRFLIN